MTGSSVRRIPGKPDRCPNCGGRDIRPSWLRGWTDAWRRFFSLAPYRCRACEHRFYRRMLKVEIEEDAAALSEQTNQPGAESA